MKTIYLCGSINGLTDAEAKGWRDEVKAALLMDYGFLDPMRNDYRGNEAGHAASIVKQDLYDIDNSDIVLVNATRPSWGTAMEVYYAHSWGKEVIAFGVPVDRASPWLEYHTDHRFETMAEALDHLRAKLA